MIRHTIQRLWGVKKAILGRILETSSKWGWKHDVNQAATKRERESPGQFENGTKSFCELHKQRVDSSANQGVSKLWPNATAKCK
jgi:hypothetical protein